MHKYLTSFFLCGVALLFTLIGASQSAIALTPADALQTSVETGRPILAMATSDNCVPCQKLKHNVYNAGELREQLGKCIVLEIDSKSDAYQQFSSQFPIATNGVPVVYFIRPDGGMTYGQSGTLTVRELQVQLTDILNQVGVTLSDDQALLARESIEKAKKFLNRNEAATALRFCDELTQLNSLAAPVREAFGVRASAVDALRHRLELIETRIAIPKSAHGAAHRLAEVYAEAETVPDLRDRAGEMLLRFHKNESTKAAVKQGMELVKARLLERRSDQQAAIEAYERMIELDEESPTSDHARKKIQLLRRQLALSGGSRISSADSDRPVANRVD